MDIATPGRGAPAATFEVPLEMLAACHGRVQAQCDLLLRLHAHLRGHGIDRQVLDAIERIRRYFDTAARDHHADEEQDLFPAMLEAVAGSDAVCIRDMMQHVVAQHRKLEAMWSQLGQALRRIEQGDSQALDGPLAQEFVAAYRAHVDFEDKELLPMAQRLLGDDQLTEVGRAMRRRRGIDDT